MRLLVLGAGEVGRRIAATASRMPPFTAITVADIDADAAARVAAPIGATSARVDATDHDAAVALMRVADVTVSAIGPASRFAVPTLRAAIEAARERTGGSHGIYADIADDPEPTLAMLGLNAEARAAGLTAVIGLGASPGVNNLLAVKAGSRLDRVDRILTGWGTGGPGLGDDGGEEPGGATAALSHWVDQCSGDIPVLRGGELVDGEPLCPLIVRYPGLGRVTVHTVGHPEPVTLRRRFPALRESDNVMDFPGYLIAALREAASVVDRGGTPHEGAERLVALLDDGGPRSVRRTLSFVWHVFRDAVRRHWLPPLWAVAEGTRSGVPTRIGACPDGSIPGGLGPVTADPAVVALAMLADGTAAPGPGVHPPETAIPHAPFFDRLRPHLVTADGTASIGVVVTEERMGAQVASEPTERPHASEGIDR